MTLSDMLATCEPTDPVDCMMLADALEESGIALAPEERERCTLWCVIARAKSFYLSPLALPGESESGRVHSALALARAEEWASEECNTYWSPSDDGEGLSVTVYHWTEDYEHIGGVYDATLGERRVIAATLALTLMARWHHAGS